MVGAALDLISIAASLSAGEKAPLARALSDLEARANHPDVVALLDQAWQAPRGHVLGLTGPPGVGKSSLTNSIISEWRKADRSVAVIAIDPSSRQSGGALLGDRIRLVTDPDDTGLFVRSMAARDQLGGLAALTFPTMVLMRALFDRVVIETVGVGQSETDVIGAADTVVFCVQPGSGDSLQFMKAGIMEIPDIAVVTKSDLGALAIRALADVKGALSLSDDQTDGWTRPVLLVSASDGSGIKDFLIGVDRHKNHVMNGLRARRRSEDGRNWMLDSLRQAYGQRGLDLIVPHVPRDFSPFKAMAWVDQHLVMDWINGEPE